MLLNGEPWGWSVGHGNQKMVDSAYKIHTSTYISYRKKNPKIKKNDKNYTLISQLLNVVILYTN